MAQSKDCNEFMKTNMSNVKLKEFPKQFCKVLDNHAPKIQKNIRATNANFITKLLQTETMHNSRNQFLKDNKYPRI